MLLQTAQTSFRLCSSHRFKEALSFGENTKKEEEGLGQGDEVQTRPDDPVLREDAGLAPGERPPSRNRRRSRRGTCSAIRRWTAIIFDYRKANAESAFAEAIEKFIAPVQDPSTPTTTPPTGKYYTDEQTKWRESAEAFERLASDYSGYYGAIGRYYAGASYLHIDRDKGISLLEQVAGKNDQPTSDLARLALAESYAANGDNDKAISLYQQLLTRAPNLKPAVEVGLGHVYEKTGDTGKGYRSLFGGGQA